jgi:DNA-binding protein H-NS
MPRLGLSTMDTESLLRLRKEVEDRIEQHGATLRRQLAILEGNQTKGPRGRRGSLAGRKIPPKYRGPSGETWAGRGARPRWLVAALKGGKKVDDFLIDKPTRKRARKRRRAKR